MKALTFLKKNKLIAIVALAYLVVFIIAPEKATQSVGNSVYYLLEMLQVLPIIFLLTVVIDAWVPKELIMRGFGEKSGAKGNLFSLLLGSISAGPIYAAFPIGKILLSKGASIMNIVIILSAWAVIKIPMLANEAKFLGLDFMVVRWILTVVSIIIMGYITAMFVKKKDIPNDELNEQYGTFFVREDFCIGCGLCSKSMPEFFEIRDKKARIKALPENDETINAIMQTAEKCPTKAIVYKEAIEEKKERTKEIS